MEDAVQRARAEERQALVVAREAMEAEAVTVRRRREQGRWERCTACRPNPSPNNNPSPSPNPDPEPNPIPNPNQGGRGVERGGGDRGGVGGDEWSRGERAVGGGAGEGGGGGYATQGLEP